MHHRLDLDWNNQQVQVKYRLIHKNMKLMQQKTFSLCLFILVLTLLNAHGQSVSNSTLGVSVSSKYLVKISGQQTNNIFACTVVRGVGKNIDDHALVLFEPESKQALAVEATKDVYFLNGRLFLLSRDTQSFWLTMARPLESGELSTKAIADVANQSALDKLHSESQYKKMIDLRPLLKSETDQHLAQPLFLKSVQPKIENQQIAVYFESYTGINGKVVFDSTLNVISSQILTENDFIRDYHSNLVPMNTNISQPFGTNTRPQDKSMPPVPK
jgi:hypothetical protein